MSRSVRKLLYHCKLTSCGKSQIQTKSMNLNPNALLSKQHLCPINSGSQTNKRFYTNTPASNYLVPIVVEQTGRGERSYDIYSRLLKGMFYF